MSDEDMEAFLDMSRISEDYAEQLTQVQTELAAANATLDALRERLPEYDTGPEDWEFGDLMRCVADFHNILYPQPKETTDDAG